MVKGWIAKVGLSAINLLSVEQAKARLHILDTEFKRYHMDIIHSLDDESEIERKEAAMEKHEIKVAHIFLDLKLFLLLPYYSFQTCSYDQDEKQGTKGYATMPC